MCKKIVETFEKSRWEVCPRGAAGPVGKAIPKPAYKDKEQRGLAPTLLRTCCVTLRMQLPLSGPWFPYETWRAGLGWGVSAVRFGWGGSLTDPP